MIQIVVVTRGDTLFKLAAKYGTTIEEIVKDNGIDASVPLVVGQTLLINMKDNVYYVQPGDTLYKIALTYNISVSTLSKANNLSSKASLQVGQSLYIPNGTKKEIEAIAYLQPTSEPIKSSLLAATKNIAPYVTYLAYFSFEINRDGTLKIPTNLNDVLEIAKQNKVIPMLVVSNLENGNFSPSLTKEILTNAATQNKLITNILDTAQKYNMRDIHFDFENVLAENRDDYNQFLRNVKRRLPQGYTLSTTLSPKTSSTQKGPFVVGIDYKSHGKIVDFVVIMTYDWGWQGGPPLAVSPIGPVRDVIQYAKTEMPAKKIIMGQNLYGFDWTLPFKVGNPPAKALSSVAAVALASKYNVPILFDTGAQAPHFTYVDNNGKRHEVWFEDARSIQAKLNLIKEQGIRGISYWKIGLPFPQNWRLLTENFIVTKKG
ncbi:LysM peptidoglycan-binding domain-containing protein [Ectobacillus polymachus]|uniref:LysM peptidoglycan-binding domain-containing protein n=1 Tax=Ectobacillus polymachus TaxID=1508806 RepID=UPI003A88C3CC